MRSADSSSVHLLELAGIRPRPELARLIPEDLARRYHVVPIAEEHGRVTVAMADPDNKRALELVRDRLHSTPYIVRSDRRSIGTLLQAVSSPNPRQGGRVLACEPWGSTGPAFREYAQRVADRLQAELTWRAIAPEEEHRVRLAQLFGDGWDLILCAVSGTAELGRRSRASQAYCHAPASTDLLLVRKPRWPLERVLFLVQGGEAEPEALEWVRRLCRPDESRATVLTIVPAVPAMFAGLQRMEVTVTDVLSDSSELGRHLRQIARRLAAWQFESRVRIRQGAPNWELQAELDAGDYDLLVTAAQPRGALARYLVPDLTERAIAFPAPPILVHRSSTAHAAV